jgi:hypothetical protein
MRRWSEEDQAVRGHRVQRQRAVLLHRMSAAGHLPAEEHRAVPATAALSAAGLSSNAGLGRTIAAGFRANP